MLKPQDVVVTLKLLLCPGKRPSFSQLGHDLSMSASEVHASVKRARAARLLMDSETGVKPNVTALKEFLLHGIKYAFPAVRGELSRGMPTSYAAPPLNSQISPGNDPPPVWPDPEGTVRGFSLVPLYSSVPKAAKRDGDLYELLTLIDALREGRARERNFAAVELVKRLRVRNHAAA